MIFIAYTFLRTGLDKVDTDVMKNIDLKEILSMFLIKFELVWNFDAI